MKKEPCDKSCKTGNTKDIKPKGGVPVTVAEYHECPKMPVSCSVENCHYNKERACHAKEILVSRTGDQHAHTPEGTFCATFENRMS